MDLTIEELNTAIELVYFEIEAVKGVDTERKEETLKTLNSLLSKLQKQLDKQLQEGEGA